MKAYPIDADMAHNLRELAKTNTFFASMYRNYEKYGTLTERQYRALQNESDPRLRIGDVMVVNRLMRDNRLLCFHCRDYATVPVGKVGVCEKHVDKQEEENRRYAAERGAYPPLRSVE